MSGIDDSGDGLHAAAGEDAWRLQLFAETEALRLEMAALNKDGTLNPAVRREHIRQRIGRYLSHVRAAPLEPEDRVNLRRNREFCTLIRLAGATLNDVLGLPIISQPRVLLLPPWSGKG